MPKRTSQSGSELFIVDNSDQEWKVQRYLKEWCQLSKRIDICTGYFEIGSLLALDGEWQKVDKFRVLMGDEVSKRTHKAFEQALGQVRSRLDDNLERIKDGNDFLIGVPAIVEAIRSGRIECRVYRKEKFHAKAYITHSRIDVVGAAALVGSSNFTFPGLTENIELNVQITGAPVTVLQEWFEEHWEQAEDVSLEILRTVERHVREYSPFEVYVRSLNDYFKGHEQTADEWEQNSSKVFRELARYQQDGYHGLLKRGEKFGGAFLCDGVGLGKTFVGMMLIERLVIRENRRVALFVTKGAREAVWEATFRQYLPEILNGFYSFKIFNHTDLQRAGFQDTLAQMRAQANVIVIDEAHHFRNTGLRGEDESQRLSRYWTMYDICEGKQVYLLTATPVNNHLTDLQHQIELFSRDRKDHFRNIGINSLAGHVKKLEKALETAIRVRIEGEGPGDITMLDAERVLSGDDLFRELVVQRSRAYVKASMKQEGGAEVLFPMPKEPRVQEYSVAQTYGKLLGMIEDAFHKENPLFSLPIYYPLAYYTGPDTQIDPMKQGRQKAVVSLIRTQFLKRFESSVEAFTLSCWNLLKHLLAWVEVHAETPHEQRLRDVWKRQNAELIGYMAEHQVELFYEKKEEEDEGDFLPPELLESIERLPRDEYRLDQIISETLLDLSQLAAFLNELKGFRPSQDKKLRGLLNLLKNDSVLKKHKVLIFTEFMDTARYLKRQLSEAGIEGVEEIDSGSKLDRGDVIRRFAPYYNGTSCKDLTEKGKKEIRVLISTDVLSEGLNLQDATRLINYDLHWNPVRLMQRIGRIDRRMNPKVEERIVADHPDQKKLRGEIVYWNFLPPDELERLLALYSRVTNKTLRISRTFGIEGRKLLKPDDDYDDLRDFADAYEGQQTPVEKLKLELEALLKEHPDLVASLDGCPNRMFSGREHVTPGAKAVFFCYARQAHDPKASTEKGEDVWSLAAGDVAWYLYDLANGTILDDATGIADFVRSKRETPRRCLMERPALIDIRKKIDRHIQNTYLKKVQAPIGVKPVLRAWMELN